MIRIQGNEPASEIIKKVWSQGKNKASFSENLPTYRIPFTLPIPPFSAYDGEDITELNFNYVEYWADIVRYHGANVKVVNIFGKYKNEIAWVDTFVVRMD